MKRGIEKHVAESDTCQRQKTENIALPGKLQPMNIPNKKWEEISMDFITCLPQAEGNDATWVIVDRLTKYGHFIPISSRYNSTQLAEIYMKDIYKQHGFPKRIICDRDPKFISNYWQEMFVWQGQNST